MTADFLTAISVAHCVTEVVPTGTCPLVVQRLRVHGPLPGKAGNVVAAALVAPVAVVVVLVSLLGGEIELPKPLTKTGTEEFAVEPSPSWPTSLRPQHFIVPPVRTAQACELPTPSEMAPDGMPDTSVAVVAFVVEPLPS
jgi:hypothetical protein